MYTGPVLPEGLKTQSLERLGSGNSPRKLVGTLEVTRVGTRIKVSSMELPSRPQMPDAAAV